MALTEELQLNLRRARADIAALARELQTALDIGGNLDFGADAAVGDLDRIQQQVREVDTELGRISDRRISVDVQADRSEVERLVSDIESIGTTVARVDLDTELGQDRIDALSRRLQALRNETVRLDVDDARVDAALRDVRSQIDGLGDDPVEIEADTSPLSRALDDLAGGAVPGRIGGLMGAGIVGALATVVGAGIGAAVENAARTGTSEAAIEVAFGDPAAAARFGSVAGEAYNSGLASSIESVDEAVLTVLRLGGVEQSEAELLSLTEQSLALSESFGVSFERQLETVNALLRGRLVDSTGEAFAALFTLGQEGSQALDENSDAVREYAAEWGAAGGTIEGLIGLLSQAGTAFESDKALDGFREFRLRVGSDTDEVRAALADLGLDAGAVFDQVDGGEAAAAFDRVLSGIADVQSLAEQTDIAAALLGTPGEDNLAFFRQYEQQLIEVSADAGGNASRALTDNFDANLTGLGRSLESGDFGGALSRIDRLGEFLGIGDGVPIETFPVFDDGPFDAATVAGRLGDVLADARVQPIALDVALDDIPELELRNVADVAIERLQAQALDGGIELDASFFDIPSLPELGFDGDAIDAAVVGDSIAALVADVESQNQIRIQTLIEADQAAFAARIGELSGIVSNVFGDPLANAFDPTNIDVEATVAKFIEIQQGIAEFDANLLTIEANDVFPEDETALLVELIAAAGSEGGAQLAAQAASAIEAGNFDVLGELLSDAVDAVDLNELTAKITAAVDADFPVRLAVNDAELRALARQRLDIPVDVLASLDRSAIAAAIEGEYNVDVVAPPVTVGLLPGPLIVPDPPPADIEIFPNLDTESLFAQIAALQPEVQVAIQALVNVNFADGSTITNDPENDAGGDYYAPLLTWVAEKGNPEAIVGGHHLPSVTMGRLDRVGVLDQIRPILFDEFMEDHPELQTIVIDQAPAVPALHGAGIAPVDDVAGMIARNDYVTHSVAMFDPGVMAELASLRSEVASLANSHAAIVDPINRIDATSSTIARNTGTTAEAAVDTAGAVTARPRRPLTERGGLWR